MLISQFFDTLYVFLSFLELFMEPFSWFDYNQCNDVCKGLFQNFYFFLFFLSLLTTIFIFFFYFSIIMRNNSCRIQSGKLIFYLFLALIQYI